MFISKMVTEFLVETCETPISESPILKGIKASLRLVAARLSVRPLVEQGLPVENAIGLGSEMKQTASDGVFVREFYGLANGNARFELTVNDDVSYSDFARATWGAGKVAA